MEKLSQLSRDIQFANPEYLVLLYTIGFLFILGILVFIIRLFQRPKKTFGSRYPLVGKIKLWFFAIVATAIAILALARPFLAKNSINIKKGPAEIVFVVDGSSSMWLKAIQPSQIDIAAREILKLYPGILKDGDRAALFMLGKSTLRKVHLSGDLDRFITEVSKVGRPARLIGDEFPWGSDIALTLEDVYQRLDSQDKFFDGNSSNWQPKKSSNRLVLFFGDGDYNSLRPPKDTAEADDHEQYLKRVNDALGEFRRRGLKIYSVGIGTRTGADLLSILRDYKKDFDYNDSLVADLKDQSSRLDLEPLRIISSATGGRVISLESANADAQNFLRDSVDSNRSASFEIVPGGDRQDLWQLFLLAALCVAAIAIIFY